MTDGFWSKQRSARKKCESSKKTGCNVRKRLELPQGHISTKQSEYAGCHIHQSNTSPFDGRVALAIVPPCVSLLVSTLHPSRDTLNIDFWGHLSSYEAFTIRRRIPLGVSPTLLKREILEGLKGQSCKLTSGRKGNALDFWGEMIRTVKLGLNTEKDTSQTLESIACFLLCFYSLKAREAFIKFSIEDN